MTVALKKAKPSIPTAQAPAADEDRILRLLESLPDSQREVLLMLKVLGDEPRRRSPSDLLDSGGDQAEGSPRLRQIEPFSGADRRRGVAGPA